MQKKKGGGKAKSGGGGGGGKAGGGALKVPFGLVAPSNSKPTEGPAELYQDCTALNQQKLILRHVFDGHQWLKWFTRYSTPPYTNKPRVRGLRLMVQIGTIDAVLRGKYFLSPDQSVNLDKKVLTRASLQTKMYQSDHRFKSWSSKHNTEITVVEGDCLEAGSWLKRTKGCNPAVLNMASRSNPNGGYQTGAAAQEENLTRRTNLFQCLDDPYQVNAGKKWRYPLPEFGGAYSPGVCVFRRAESKGYAYMAQPDYLSIISVWAYKDPPTEQNPSTGELKLSGHIIQHFKRKITAILNIALDNGHDSVVLGAFGCGAYGNPPNHIAQLFKEVITGDFKGCFSHILFAIYDDVNAHRAHNPRGNVIPFADVFNTTAPKLNDLLGEPDEVIQFENEWEQVADNAPEGEKEYSETTQTQGEDTASGKGKEKNK